MRIEARLGLVARQARVDAGLGLLDLARDAGVSQATLSRFENGRGNRRDLDRIVTVYARTLGLTSDDLWRRALDMP